MWNFEGTAVTADEQHSNYHSNELENDPFRFAHSLGVLHLSLVSGPISLLISHPFERLSM